MHTPSRGPTRHRARERPGHETQHPRARPGRSPPGRPSFRAPARPAPLLLARRGGGGSSPLPSPSLPIGQTAGRAPPSIGCGRGPLPAADSPLAEAGDRETLRGFFTEELKP
ncbi:PREDICTED: uncharacterized protein LOC106146716 isoform X2 [Chinchilla lanigera]|uniref:uncharacterized protein LOC106146716 isoform X2 n=1 Tax=Chinchilla lanigera TaxID=34839 RepID=UPI00069632D4|nr:PREDICTED: uncharacterized protein LOC106146716 isoform X2 [Chinchilla lanigera]